MASVKTKFEAGLLDQGVNLCRGSTEDRVEWSMGRVSSSLLGDPGKRGELPIGAFLLFFASHMPLL